MITVIAVVLLVALALIAADRACARLTGRAASPYLSEPFGGPLTVRVHGAAFLPQAARGRYRRVELSGDDLRIGQLSGTSLRAHIYNAELPPRDLLRRRISSLACERLAGQLVVPYRELARMTRIPGLTLNYEDGCVMASAALPVPGVSQLARVSGEARLSIGGDGAVWLRVRGLSVAGIRLPSAVLGQLVPSLNVPIPLPRLPYGVCLDGLTPTASGLVVTASADHVVFTVRPDAKLVAG